jgi:hypothetical protein
MAIHGTRLLDMPLVDIIVLSVIIWTVGATAYIIHRHTERGIIRKRLEMYDELSKTHDNDIFNPDD